MGVCKSRQTQTAAAAKQMESKGKAQHCKEGTFTAKSRGTPRTQPGTAPWATNRTWARLHEEAPLNPDADPFMPQTQSAEVTRPPPGLQTRTPPWRQGEANNLSAKDIRARRPEPAPVRGAPRPPLHRQMQSQSQGKPEPNSANFILRINEHKKLLQGSNVGDSCEKDAKDKRTTVPPVVPTAVLGQLVANAFTVPPMNMSGEERIEGQRGPTDSTDPNDLEGTLRTKPRQFHDDTFMERFLDDRDFSEQAYWSDGGDGKFPAPRGRSALIPSAHRIRRVERNRAVRSYVMQDFSEGLDHAVALLLGQLQVFKQLEVLDIDIGMGPASDPTVHAALRRAGKQTKPLPPNRRFFIGLKEVFRRMRQGLIKVLIVAPDVEGTIDDRMRELLTFSYQHEIPVIFALSRKRIGRALGKNLDFTVVGIVDVTGARELCNKVESLAWDHRLSWLNRKEKEIQSSSGCPRSTQRQNRQTPSPPTRTKKEYLW